MIRTHFAAALLLAAILPLCHAQTATVVGKTALRAGAGTGKDLSLHDTAEACTKAPTVAGSYVCVTPVTVPAPPAVTTWVRIGPEKAKYTLSAPAVVRFGSSTTKWVEKQMAAGEFWCNTTEFGDPTPGAAKVCERKESGAAPSEPAASQPSTTPTTPATGGVPSPADSAAYPASGAITARTGQVIERLRITSAAGSCITIPAGVTDVVIRDSEIGPCGQPGDTSAKGVDIKKGASRITVQRNYIHDMATALYADGARHPIVFDRNSVTEIRGPFPRGQAVQFNGVSGGDAASRITCNVSDVQGSKSRNVEDHINQFDSPGAGPGPLRTEIAYNRIRGGHPTSNSGTAIMVGDGSSGGNVWVHHNTVVNVRNVGIGVAGGIGIAVEDNRVFMDRSVIYTNVGLYVWSQGGGDCSGHSVKRNRANVLASTGSQNPWWNGGNCGTVDLASNVWPDTTLSAAMFDEVPAQCR